MPVYRISGTLRFVDGFAYHVTAPDERTARTLADERASEGANGAGSTLDEVCIDCVEELTPPEPAPTPELRYFAVSAHGIGGFTVAAEYHDGLIEATASDGRGIVATERFTVEDSGIRDAATLESYCKAMIAQWQRRRRHGIQTPWPLEDAR